MVFTEMFFCNGDFPWVKFLTTICESDILIVIGDIAQLVERLNGIQEVSGSTPLISTNLRFSPFETGFFRAGNEAMKAKL